MATDPARIGSIVLSVERFQEQLRFWCAVLDYEPREAPEPDWVVLRPRSGVGPNVSLARRASTTGEPPRVHLDLYAEDQGAEVDRIVALGASRFDEPNRPDDADYVILLDPDGNRFCVVDAG